MSRAVSYTQTADEMEIAASGGNAVRRLAVFALGGWGLALLTSGKRRRNNDWPLVASISLLLGLAGAGVLWGGEPGDVRGGVEAGKGGHVWKGGRKDRTDRQ